MTSALWASMCKVRSRKVDKSIDSSHVLRVYPSPHCHGLHFNTRKEAAVSEYFFLRIQQNKPNSIKTNPTALQTVCFVLKRLLLYFAWPAK